MQTLSVDNSEQLPDSIPTCDVKRGYYILLLFLFLLLFFVFCWGFFGVFSQYFFFQGQQDDFYKYSRVYILCCYYHTSQFGKTLTYKRIRQLRLISFQLIFQFEAGLWISEFNFHCVSYFTLPEFPAKDALKCIVNPTFLTGCCDSTLINLALKTIVLIFNTNHKMRCCQYCY